ncbi:pilus assembly PilX N-terminal domain-containing protein [Candidatus Peregrinibacteria bacterium]|nr:pilus assembly PilX N-terminal domain-containing protein [Candidatus Peregrinibacteria bacterium]
MRLKINNKGVSLPLVVGLVMILMLASVAVNELIIRTLRSASQIEASDRAYFAAEAGIEDGLYELSEHYAGYEAADRKDNFGGDVKWDNDWAILSRSNNTVFGTSTNPNLVLFPNQKLILGLYNDNSSSIVDENGINPFPPSNFDIDLQSGINGNFSITFRIPYDRPGGYSLFLLDGLDINNDKDFETNEDGPGDKNICDTYEGEDSDCDGKEDEDSDQDPVILWKITDDMGNSLVPIRGCFENDGSEFQPEGTEICEKDFVNSGYLQVSIDQNTDGINQDGNTQSISEFINDIDSNSKAQLELLVVAPLVDYSNAGTANVSLPYLEYEISSGLNTLPLPYFTIESDGWYRDYKQTIVTTLTPKTAVPLFDFTIIQQQ